MEEAAEEASPEPCVTLRYNGGGEGKGDIRVLYKKLQSALAMYVMCVHVLRLQRYLITRHRRKREKDKSTAVRGGF